MPIIVSKQLELEKTREYRLSIQADLNGFSFSVVNDVNKKCLHLYKSEFVCNRQDYESFVRNTASLVDSLPILSSSFKSVSLIINTEKYALVPLSDFKESSAHLYLKKLHDLEDLEEVDYVRCEKEGLAIVFAADSTLINCIKAVQPDFKLLPSVYFPVKYLKTFEDHNKIYVQYFKGLVHVVIYEGDRLMLCNSYPALHFNSALYFIFLALKSVHFNTEMTTIYAAGNFSTNDLADLTKYFPKVRFFRNRQTPIGDSDIEMKYSHLAFES